MKIVAKNVSDTKEIAQNFASTLKGGEIVLLNGDLGAGKTTFTQFVLESLGVNDIISSPTFAILKTYQGKFVFHHFDTYRITTEEAIESGFDEVLDEKNSIKFIEWSETIKELLPKNCIKIDISRLSENEREFNIVNE